MSPLGIILVFIGSFVAYVLIGAVVVRLGKLIFCEWSAGPMLNDESDVLLVSWAFWPSAALIALVILIGYLPWRWIQSDSGEYKAKWDEFRAKRKAKRAPKELKKIEKDLAA